MRLTRNIRAALTDAGVMTEEQIEARRRENRREGRPAFDPPHFYEGAAADRGETGAMEAAITPPNIDEVADWLRRHAARLGRPVAVDFFVLPGAVPSVDIRADGRSAAWRPPIATFGGWATELKDRFNEVGAEMGVEVSTLEPDDPSLVLVMHRAEDRDLVERLFRAQDWLRRGREQLLAGDAEGAIRSLRRAADGGVPAMEWGPPMTRAYKAAGRNDEARRLARVLLSFRRRGRG